MIEKINQKLIYIMCIVFSLTVTNLRNNPVIDGIIIGVCAFTTLISIIYFRKWNIKKYVKENWLIVIYLIIRVISIILLNNKLDNIKTFLYEIYFLIIVQQFYNNDKANSNTPITILIIINFIFNFVTFICFIFQIYNYETIIYSNTNQMASMSCICLLLYLTFLKKTKKKILSIAYIIFSLIILVIADSRTPILMILAYILMNLITKFKLLSENALKRTFMILLNAFIIVVIIFSIVNKKNQVPSKLETFMYEITTARYYLWKYSIISLEESPLTGIETSEIGDKRFKNLPVTMYEYITPSRMTFMHLNNNHNGFIQLLVSDGYIIYIIFMLWLYKNVMKLEMEKFYIVSSILILNLFENLFILAPSIQVFLLFYYMTTKKEIRDDSNTIMIKGVENV